MTRVHVRFYAQLGDFLPAARRGHTIEHDVPGRASVKDVIESLGVPHPEVELILADGDAVAFEHVVRDGERVAVYPRFRSLDVSALHRAGEPLPLVPRFVLDGHLGRLAAYLRLLGFDVTHRRDAEDAELARVAAVEDRVLLTRDLGLLKRSIVRHGALVRAVDPREQVAEVLDRYDLHAEARPFARCLKCNGLLAPISRDEARLHVPSGVLDRHDEFHACASCGRVYWRGSHHARMETLIAHLLARRRGRHGWWGVGLEVGVGSA